MGFDHETSQRHENAQRANDCGYQDTMGVCCLELILIPSNMCANKARARVIHLRAFVSALRKSAFEKAHPLHEDIYNKYNTRLRERSYLPKLRCIYLF